MQTAQSVQLSLQLALSLFSRRLRESAVNLDGCQILLDRVEARYECLRLFDGRERRRRGAVHFRLRCWFMCNALTLGGHCMFIIWAVGITDYKLHPPTMPTAAGILRELDVRLARFIASMLSPTKKILQ